ncbi:MAG: hypothetical protein U1A28_03900 [Patescibacteria group bacterium]|nr:hypothetical protein [Patescibacteria group bacterium]
MAKPLYDPCWTNESALRLTLACRSSYNRYGDCPPLDEFDTKSLVYLLNVEYPLYGEIREPHAMEPAGHGIEHSPPLIEEWVSMRFIPGRGEPYGTSDFTEVCHVSGELASLFRDELYHGDPEFMRTIVTMSRLCGIPPFCAVETNTRLPYKHRCMAHCFALFHKVFFRGQKRKFKFLTGILRPEFIETTLTLCTTEGERLPRFEPSSALFGDRGTLIRINRGAAAYRFPSFFLHVPGLLDCLANLLESSSITPETLRAHTGCSIEDFRRDRGSTYGTLRHLGKLLTAEGQLAAASITGAELRTIVDKHVPDGPQFYCMHTARWSTSIEQFFVACSL